MKILFYYRNEESLGVEYLSAVLKRAGHEVGLIFNPGLDNAFHYRSKLMKVFDNKDLLVEKAVKFSPDLIAFSSITNEYPDIRLMAGRLKKKLKVPTIIGGIHPTAIPDFVLSDPAFDMVCVGEGEDALLELVDKMEQGRDYYTTRNIWFKKNNGVIVKNQVRPLIEDLDSLPFPDKDLFYKYGCFSESLSAISSRGCPFSCSYCHNHIQQKLYKGKGRYVRRRSVRSLISELAKYKKKYKMKSIYFREDLFVSDKEWLREFSCYYPNEIDLPFYCFAFPGYIDEEKVIILKKAGCKDLLFGVESGNEKIRKNILNKNTSDKDIKDSVGITKKHKIPVRSTVMFGFPGETPRNMWETVKLIEQLNPKEVLVYLLYPYPGTDILKYCQSRGLIDSQALLQIYNGEGSNLEESIFKHSHKELAYVVGRLLPLLVRAPSFLKFFIRKIMQTRKKKLANMIFLLSIPFLYKIGYQRLKELVKMAIISKKKSTYHLGRR